jgi:mRNA-degrading endonuclease RelE of RelBE toxin-antitoxin system
MQIIQTNRFKKAVKKLNTQQKSELDQAVKAIAENPFLGEQKRGDLDFLQVYKFRMNNQLTLLAYSYEEQIITLTLLDVGSHENFYRDIKRSI